jgi:hypothetical protein
VGLLEGAERKEREERRRERMAGWEEAGILELGKKAESQQMISGSQQGAYGEAGNLQMQPKQILEWGMRGQTQWLESLGSLG